MKSSTLWRGALALSALLWMSPTLGCDDGGGGGDTTADAPDAAVVDAGSPDSAPPEGAPPDASLPDMSPPPSYARPGPRVPLGEPLGGGLRLSRWLVRHDGVFYTVTGDGWLYRAEVGGDAAWLGRDLPVNARLLSTGEQLLAVGDTGFFDARTAAPVLEGRQGIVVTSVQRAEGGWYWLESSGGGQVVRLATFDGAPEVLASDLGPVTALAVGERLWVGLGGDEPRAILALPLAGGEATRVAESRFVPSEMVLLGDHLYALMLTGAGWLERLPLDAGVGAQLERLGYAPRGSGHLHAQGEALLWKTSTSVQRWAEGDAAPKAIFTTTRPGALWVEDEALFWVDDWSGKLMRGEASQR